MFPPVTGRRELREVTIDGRKTTFAVFVADPPAVGRPCNEAQPRAGAWQYWGAR